MTETAIVIILIVVEDTLRALDGYLHFYDIGVLILIVMEDTLRDSEYHIVAVNSKRS